MDRGRAAKEKRGGMEGEGCGWGGDEVQG